MKNFLIPGCITFCYTEPTSSNTDYKLTLVVVQLYCTVVVFIKLHDLVVLIIPISSRSIRRGSENVISRNRPGFLSFLGSWPCDLLR